MDKIKFILIPHAGKNMQVIVEIKYLIKLKI